MKYCLIFVGNEVNINYAKVDKNYTSKECPNSGSITGKKNLVIEHINAAFES